MAFWRSCKGSSVSRIANIRSAAAFPFLIVKLALDIDFAGVMILYARPRNGIKTAGGIVFSTKTKLPPYQIKTQKTMIPKISLTGPANCVFIISLFENCSNLEVDFSNL